MFELISFLMKHNLKIIIKSTEYIFLEGYIIYCNKLYLKLKDDSLNKIHIVLYSNIKGVGLIDEILEPGPCIFNKLPIKYPPYCWSCSKNPNPLIIELIQLKKTNPPDTSIGFSLNQFEQIEITLSDIYEINSTFIFICMPMSSNPDIKIPIALTTDKLDNMDLDIPS